MGKLLTKVVLVSLLVVLLLFPNIARAGFPEDLNGDGVVSISEVQTTINAFLGLILDTSHLASYVLPGDLNRDGVVSISEVQTVINAFLGIIPNIIPIANAGPAQNVATGTLVALDGSKSSGASSDPLTYNWTLTSKPDGSNAILSITTVPNPTFMPDLAGSYTFNLVVSNGTTSSAASAVTVVAATGDGSILISISY